MVSVLVTSYNREKYIAQCIESLLKSTYANFELIIVDDSSTDSTADIAKEYAKQDDRIKLYINKINLGQFGNRNKAAALANREFIKFLDSDDTIEPDGLRIMVDALANHPGAGVASEYQANDLEGKLPYLFSPKDAYLSYFYGKSSLLYIGPSGTIFRKAYFDKVGGFDEEIGILADTLLMLRIAAISSVVGLPKGLFYWRRHEDQVTVEQNKKFEMLDQRYTINSAVLNSSNSPLSLKETSKVKKLQKKMFGRNLTRFALDQGEFRQAYLLLKKHQFSYEDLLNSFIPNSFL